MSGDDKIMPRRSHGAIDQLPDEIREQVDEWLAPGPGRLTYLEIAANLDDMGYGVSKSSVGRYAARFALIQESLNKAVEQAQRLQKILNLENKEPHVIAKSLLWSKTLEALVDAEPLRIESVGDYNAVGLTTARLERIGVLREKWEAERKQLIDDAFDRMLGDVRSAVGDDEELLEMLVAKVEQRRDEAKQEIQ